MSDVNNLLLHRKNIFYSFEQHEQHDREPRATHDGALGPRRSRKPLAWSDLSWVYICNCGWWFGL